MLLTPASCLLKYVRLLPHITTFIQTTHTIAQIELLDSQLEKIEAEMTDIMKFNASVIIIILGIGYINDGMILGEIGDIHCFSTPSKSLFFNSSKNFSTPLLIAVFGIKSIYK